MELALRCRWDPRWTPSLLNKLQTVEGGPGSSKLTVSLVQFGCHWRTLLRKTTAAWLSQ